MTVNGPRARVGAVAEGWDTVCMYVGEIESAPSPFDCVRWSAR